MQKSPRFQDRLLLLFLPRFLSHIHPRQMTREMRCELNLIYQLPQSRVYGSNRNLVVLLQEASQLRQKTIVLFLLILCCFITKCIANISSIQRCEAAKLYILWTDFKWRTLTVFGLRRGPRSDHHDVVRPLSSSFSFPTFHAALKSRAYDRQQSSGNYPSTPPPRIPHFLHFFKEGK